MKVNEIFYSLQGEGRYTGVPAVFVRLSGCNMKCWFCDTQHEDGTEMTESQIVEQVTSHPTRHVVITGGEPMMQITPELTQLLHKAGRYVQVETNGTLALPPGVELDWVTCSPKTSHVRLQHIDELKVVYEGVGQDMSPWESIEAQEYRLQPCDTGDETKNQAILESTVAYLLSHPKWHLSLQTHKMLNIR